MVDASIYIVYRLETYDKNICDKHFNYFLVATIMINMLITQGQIFINLCTLLCYFWSSIFFVALHLVHIMQQKSFKSMKELTRCAFSK